MVVRIPTVMVALGFMLVFDAAVLVIALSLHDLRAPIVLLPLGAIAGGWISGRWSSRIAPVPGLDVGLLAIAMQIGLAFGALPMIQPYTEPDLVMLQVVAAMGGGLIGALVARRAAQPHLEYQPISSQ